jgi:hypothetical protein
VLTQAAGLVAMMLPVVLFVVTWSDNPDSSSSKISIQV